MAKYNQLIPLPFKGLSRKTAMSCRLQCVLVLGIVSVLRLLKLHFVFLLFYYFIIVLRPMCRSLFSTAQFCCVLYNE